MKKVLRKSSGAVGLSRQPTPTMTAITTCTPQSEAQMLDAINKGNKVALHLENLETPCGMAIFCKSIEEARAAFRNFAKGWEQFMVCEYRSDWDVNDAKQIAIGWI
jgi:hypothetical protein